MPLSLILYYFSPTFGISKSIKFSKGNAKGNAFTAIHASSLLLIFLIVLRIQKAANCHKAVGGSSICSYDVECIHGMHSTFFSSYFTNCQSMNAESTNCELINRISPNRESVIIEIHQLHELCVTLLGFLLILRVKLRGTLRVLKRQGQITHLALQIILIALVLRLLGIQ